MFASVLAAASCWLIQFLDLGCFRGSRWCVFYNRSLLARRLESYPPLDIRSPKLSSSILFGLMSSFGLPGGTVGEAPRLPRSLMSGWSSLPSGGASCEGFRDWRSGGLVVVQGGERSSGIMEKFVILFVVGLLLHCLNPVASCEQISAQETQYSAINCRKHVASLLDFGGKGDGITSNTAAFKAAVANLSKVASDGGALLVVPPGKWLTGSFNLASHFTLYIHKNAVLLASQVESDYPLIDPLPSYGRGRDADGKRFSSLITGTNLTDVVITGGNGTIDGQGETWWKKFKAGQLNNTRPYLIELLFSNQVQISNLTLINSPSWHVHPTYCRDVIVEYITILAPIDSPNTDGINPDSCINTRIRDSYVVSGDDCIAVKSGWDQYGIKFGRPTQHLSIKRFTCISPDSAVIALGSEMSGGIQDVRAEQIYALNSQSGVRIKTAPGRGAYVRDVYVRDFSFETIKYIFWTTGSYGSHPDDGYDPKALPEIRNINFRDVVAKNVTFVGYLSGIKEDPFTGICISNVTAELAMQKEEEKEEKEYQSIYDLFVKGDKKKKKKPKSKLPWNCTDVSGVSSRVTPKACDLLPEKQVDCAFPGDTLAIDTVVLKTCSVSF
ncbi:Pectin lyase-like superfamily protein [Striga hermonthica]|uniref:Pectin lyase-like superfamily protein n=1 Tax=Striga hermonthica TaxID=68872 RepID=A0A9N7R4A5_STRHE|nr:Pectin lyase-like superfamily protein [Striga hermonthica]